MEGSRTQETQMEYYAQGKSKLDGINKLSKHQVSEDQPLSMAVDIAPYKIDWNDKNRFYFLAGIIKAVAAKLLEEGKITHAIRWGGDWDSDNNFKDQSFFDLPHFELI